MYFVQVGRKAEKQIDRLSQKIRESALRKLMERRDNPRPHSVKNYADTIAGIASASGSTGLFYDIFDDRLLVIVIEATHRRYSYR